MRNCRPRVPGTPEVAPSVGQNGGAIGKADRAKPSPFGALDYTCVSDSAYQPSVLERLEKCSGRMR